MWMEMELRLKLNQKSNQYRIGRGWVYLKSEHIVFVHCVFGVIPFLTILFFSVHYFCIFCHHLIYI